jgi:hypothetical protein
LTMLGVSSRSKSKSFEVEQRLTVSNRCMSGGWANVNSSEGKEDRERQAHARRMSADAHVCATLGVRRGV